ncbi:MAG: Spy/CpxP family protein refolding chaperone [Gammaproteobacteria bacterium]|jgi:hypothetical protein
MKIRYLAVVGLAWMASGIALADDPPAPEAPPAPMMGYGPMGHPAGYGPMGYGRMGGFGMMGPMGGSGMMGPMGMFSPAVVSELNLTDAQKKTLADLQQQARALHDQMHAQRLAFHGQMQAMGQDPAKLADLMDQHRQQMNAFHAGMQALAGKQVEFYRSLSADQQKQVAEAFSHGRGYGPCGQNGPRFRSAPRAQ